MTMLKIVEVLAQLRNRAEMKLNGRLTIALVSIATGLTPAHAQEFEIPEPIAGGHDELHARMEAATSVEGEVGAAARAVMDVLGPHFEKEEQYALPQLGLFPELVGAPLAPDDTGLTPEQTRELIERTERLRTELPKMIEEHRQIAAALEDLHAAADAAGEAEYARLAREIEAHARTEEQVLYPTALLIGDYARLLENPSR